MCVRSGRDTHHTHPPTPRALPRHLSAEYLDWLFGTMDGYLADGYHDGYMGRKDAHKDRELKKSKAADVAGS